MRVLDSQLLRRVARESSEVGFDFGNMTESMPCKQVLVLDSQSIRIVTWESSEAGFDYRNMTVSDALLTSASTG